MFGIILIACLTALASLPSEVWGRPRFPDLDANFFRTSRFPRKSFFDPAWWQYTYLKGYLIHTLFSVELLSP